MLNQSIKKNVDDVTIELVHALARERVSVIYYDNELDEQM